MRKERLIWDKAAPGHSDQFKRRASWDRIISAINDHRNDHLSTASSSHNPTLVPLDDPLSYELDYSDLLQIWNIKRDTYRLDFITSVPCTMSFCQLGSRKTYCESF